MAFALPEINMSARLRRVLRIVGYSLFAIFVAVETLYLTLPRDRIKEKIEATLSQDPATALAQGNLAAIGMNVDIGELGLTLLTGPGLAAEHIELRSRPVNPNDKPARYVIDDAIVKVGILGAMFGRPTYRFVAHGFDGEVSGTITMAPSEQKILINAKGLVLTGVQAIAQSVGLPLVGAVSGKIDAVAPQNLAANMSGTVELSVQDLVVGDGKAKLTVPNDPFLAAGVTFPRLRIGTLNGKLVMEKGKGKLEGLYVKSPDVEAYLDGYVELRDPLGTSQLHVYLRFKPSEALVKREPTVDLMMNALGALAKRPDGFLGFQITGPLSALYYLPNTNPPAGVTLGNAPASPAPVAATGSAVKPTAPTAPPPTAPSPPTTTTAAPSVAPAPSGEPSPPPSPAPTEPNPDPEVGAAMRASKHYIPPPSPVPGPPPPIPGAPAPAPSEEQPAAAERAE
jgi:type II secretion system protein N